MLEYLPADIKPGSPQERNYMCGPHVRKYDRKKHALINWIQDRYSTRRCGTNVGLAEIVEECGDIVDDIRSGYDSIPSGIARTLGWLESKPPNYRWAIQKLRETLAAMQG